MLSAPTSFKMFADVDWNGHMDLNGGGWVLMTLGMIAFWGLLIFAVVWVVRETGRGSASTAVPGADAGAQEPAAILDRRLAEGDLSVEEHRERRRALSPPPDGPEPDDEANT